MAAAFEARDSGAVARLLGPVAAVVHRQLPPVSAPARLDADASLTNLGLDSLGLAGLVVDLEMTFAVELPEHMLVPETFQTIRTVAAALATLTGAPRADDR
jgi:acyl carrier protein